LLLRLRHITPSFKDAFFASATCCRHAFFPAADISTTPMPRHYAARCYDAVFISEERDIGRIEMTPRVTQEMARWLINMIDYTVIAIRGVITATRRGD